MQCRKVQDQTCRWATSAAKSVLISPIALSPERNVICEKNYQHENKTLYGAEFYDDCVDLNHTEYHVNTVPRTYL